MIKPAKKLFILEHIKEHQANNGLKKTFEEIRHLEPWKQLNPEELNYTKTHLEANSELIDELISVIQEKNKWLFIHILDKLQAEYNDNEYRELLADLFHQCGFCRSNSKLAILFEKKQLYINNKAGNIINTKDYASKSEKLSSTATDTTVLQASLFTKGLLVDTSNNISFQTVNICDEAVGEIIELVLNHSNYFSNLENLDIFLHQEIEFLELFRIAILGIIEANYDSLLDERTEFQPLFMIYLQSVFTELEKYRKVQSNIGLTKASLQSTIFHMELTTPLKLQSSANAEKGQLLAEAMLFAELKPDSVLSLLTDGFSIFFLIKLGDEYYMSHRIIEERCFILLILLVSGNINQSLLQNFLSKYKEDTAECEPEAIFIKKEPKKSSNEDEDILDFDDMYKEDHKTRTGLTIQRLESHNRLYPMVKKW